MEFINEKEDVQVRQKEPVTDVSGPGGFNWKRLRTGEKINLPRKVGKRYGFKKVTDQSQISNRSVTEGKIGNKKVETKQFDSAKKSAEFYKELIKIKGIAKKTGRDIISVFTKEQLIAAIINKRKLPFRDDVEKKLRRKYAKK